MIHRAIHFSEISARQAYKVMIGTIVPRPIAWVTTISPDGVVNAAPYSFFNCLSADPPILALGIENKPDLSFKDTAYNIRHTEVFTVNIVDFANVRAMATTAAAFGPEVDELKIAGLTAVDGTIVACPRIAEAPVAFECRRHISIAVSSAREIILGRIEMAHVREDIIDLETFYSNPEKLDAIGRMGGDGYSTTRQAFDLPTPSADEAMAKMHDRLSKADTNGGGDH